MRLFSIRRPDACVLVTTLATVVVLAMASTTTSQKVYAENPALVTLVNPLPLPVTGTVGIAGTASVTITNTAAGPVITREIGKVPYQRTRNFYPGPDTCTSTVCTVTFDPVPAGRRLEVDYASARFPLELGGTLAHVRLHANALSGSTPSILLPAAVNIGDVGVATYLTSGPVTFYIEAGDTPTLDLIGFEFVLPTTVGAEASIVGHLVAVP